MKTKNHLLLAVCIIVPFAIIFALLLRLEHLEKRIVFTRNMVASPLLKQVVTIPQQSFKSIAEVREDTIYLETWVPGLLVSYNFNLQYQSTIDLHIKPNKKFNTRFYTIVNYPGTFVYGGNTAQLVIGNIPEQTHDVHPTHTYVFSRAVAIDNNVHIFRGFVKDEPIQYFARLDLTYDSLTAINQLIDKQHDYGLSEDGILQYDKESRLLIYSYFYSSDVLVMDTSLKLMRHFHTIDKTERINIKRNFISENSQYKYTNISPKRIINYQAAVYNKKLYIMSRARDRDQHILKPSNSTNIDVYDYQKGAYQYSFPLPFIGNDKPRKFMLYHGKLIVLYKTHLAIYQLT